MSIQTWTIISHGRFQELSALDVEVLRQRLASKALHIPPDYQKHHLQALWAMYRFGLVGPGSKLDSEQQKLHLKVSEWCRKLVREQIDELIILGLSVQGNRWDHLEVLIVHECHKLAAAGILSLPAESMMRAWFHRPWELRSSLLRFTTRLPGPRL